MAAVTELTTAMRMAESIDYDPRTLPPDTERYSLCPVLPIGAENLPGKVAAQGSAVAEQPTRRRRALDCDLARRDDARHGGRAARSFRMARCRVLRDGGSPPAWR